MIHRTVNSILIGAKETCGIEYSISEPSRFVRGKCVLWLNNQFLGDPMDTVILHLALYHLRRPLVFQAEELDPSKYSGCSSSDVFDRLCQEFDTLQGFLPTDGFDHFVGRYYRNEASITFLWKNSLEFLESYPDQPKGIQSQVVSIANYRDLLKEFGNLLPIDCPFYSKTWNNF